MNLTDLKTRTEQFKKFVFIGLSSTAINYGVFFVLFQFFQIYYALAHVIGYILGVVFGYAFNRSWTFDSVIPKKKVEFVLYFTVYILSLMTSVAALQILVEVSELNPLIANILSIGVSTITNFLGCKFLVFNPEAINKLKKISVYLTPAFWIIFGIKIISSALFGSRFITEGFVPFLKYFALNLGNPYSHFSALGERLFPYPGGMLYALGLPFVVAFRSLPQWITSNLHFQLFLTRLPILAADVAIYLILCKMLPSKEKKIFWLYFASPILFYINYFHGQLDVIPTALLFLSLWALLKNKNSLSFILLGIGLATKTHLIAAIPFYLIYIYRNNFGIKKIAKLAGLTTIAFLLCNPFLFSSGFLDMVFNNPEQKRLFDLSINFGLNNLIFFIAPASIVWIFYKFANYKKLNFDSLLLTLGLTYIALIALVPPMQGWYYWSLPFLIFFFIKFKDSNSLGLWGLNFAYLAYFVVAKNGDLFASMAPSFSFAQGLKEPYVLMGNFGINADKIQNIAFTALESILIVCSLWAYQIGTASTETFQKKKSRFVIGIGGDSGVGKSTFAKLLEKLFGEPNSTLLNGDDVHKWERGDSRWQIASHLNPAGNRIHLDFDHALKLLSGEKIQRENYDHSTGKFTSPIEIKPKKFITQQGLMPFLLEEMRHLHDVKIFMEAEDLLRKEWKMERDMKERGYQTAEVERELLRRQQDSKLYIEPQKEFADWVIKHYKDSENILISEHIFKNSLFLDELVEAFKNLPTLKVEHSYPDLKFQKLKISGNVTKQEITETAYRLFPNLFDLLENQPEFENDLAGVEQLLFINYLNYFQKLRGNYDASRLS